MKDAKKLHILSVAMGMYNGGDEPSTSKGITSVTVNGKELAGSAGVQVVSIDKN